MFKRRRPKWHLVDDGKGWERFEATIIAGHSAAAVAEGEADLFRECRESGRSVEFLGASDVGGIRVYRVGPVA